MPRKPRSTEEYLLAVSPDKRAVLENLRRSIQSILGECEECISYSMPAFRFDGHIVAGFLATKSGCSYFPFSGTTLGTLAAKLTKYERTKSALHFDPSRPLPKSLVRELLKVRIAENKKPIRPASKSSCRAEFRRT